MAITDPLVLPGDVMLMPVADLPAYLCELLEYEDGDYVLTRPRSRATSRIIDAQTAELLRLFQTPTLIVQAVIHFSKAHRLDPEQVLVDAFPILQSLMDASLLVAANAEPLQQILPSLAVGEQFAGCEVLKCIHVVEDTEVYQAQRTNGEMVALKVSRPGCKHTALRMFEQEISVLKCLDNTVNLPLLDSGISREQRFLILEWCSGIEVAIAAEEIRRRGTDNRKSLLQLCGAVLDAYSHLHAQGVVHADIHTGNILVTNDGSVKIIDYGFACSETIETEDVPYRADINYFSAPEYAQAVLTGNSVPAPGMQEEQFSLAALLYYLLTGAQYLRFSLGQEEVIQQIAAASPLPFAAQDVVPWFEVEALLARALRKHPSDRFPSASAFARELKEVAMLEERPAPSLTLQATDTEAQAAQALLQNMLRHLGLESQLLSSGLTIAPTCSLTYGAAGVAYALYRIACAQNSAALLSLADIWSTQAVHTMKNNRAAFYNEENIRPEVVGYTSPYHTACGVYSVQALIGHAMGDFASQQQAVSAFITASQAPCENIDLTLGRAGTLLVSSFLLNSMLQGGMLDATPLLDFGNKIMQSIWDEIDACPVIQECSAITYLGMAHGWAGLLYATMRWCLSSGAVLPDMLEERLQQLATCAECSGRGVRWPVTLPPPDHKHPAALYMPGWCNGSAGYIHLWTLAHSMFGDELYGRLAEQAAWHAWEAGGVVSSLCCGLAGQSYGLLNLYKHTGERAWLTRAQEFTHLAVRKRGGAVHYGLAQRMALDAQCESLYHGDLGLAILIAELARPEDARMPFFE